MMYKIDFTGECVIHAEDDLDAACQLDIIFDDIPMSNYKIDNIKEIVT